MNNSLNFSRASSPTVPFNFNQLHQQNPNMLESNAHPMQGLASQFSQQMEQIPSEHPQMGMNSPMMGLAGAMSGLFPMQN